MVRIKIVKIIRIYWETDNKLRTNSFFDVKDFYNLPLTLILSSYPRSVCPIAFLIQGLHCQALFLIEYMYIYHLQQGSGYQIYVFDNFNVERSICSNRYSLVTTSLFRYCQNMEAARKAVSEVQGDPENCARFSKLTIYSITRQGFAFKNCQL